VTRAEPAEALEVLERGETEEGWSRLSMWAALPVALSVLQPKVLSTLLPALVASVVVLQRAMAGGRSGVAVAVVVVVVVGLGAWVGWAVTWRYRFRYRVGKEGITVRSGVAYRSEVGLGWERVRNVDVRQAFYFRPLDRVTLVLEGTGGSDEVVTILAVTREFAEDVRRQVVTFGSVGAAGSPASEEDAPEVADGVLHQPRPTGLLVHGALNGRAFALLLAGLGGLYSVLNPWVEEAELVGAVERVIDGGVDGVASWLVVAVPALVLVPVLLVAISAVAALVRYWDFSLTVDGDRYLFSHGLAETQERSLRATKLQALTTVETAVGRRFGRCHLLVHKASSTTETDGDQSDGTMLVPALSVTEADRLVQVFDPGAAPRPHLQPVMPAYRRFWLQRLLALVAAVSLAALTAVLTVLGTPGTLLVGLSALTVSAAALTAVLVTVTWRNWGWALQGTVLFITYGVLGRHHQVFHLDRVQHVAVTRSPYQRRHGLATLTLALPDGDRSIPFLDHADALELANRTLHKVETVPHLDL